MKSVKIKEGIYWVGAIDWNVRNFHGYLTQRGTTYNAYLIIDEKVTLVDTVKSTLAEEMMLRIADVIDPGKIDIIVSNHVEMDHSGSLPAIMEKAPDATVLCSPKGEKGLRTHYRKDWKFRIVGTGDSVILGKRSLNFVLTPMIHWPDNMMTYMPEEKILFSNDAFGQHLASSVRFDDQYPVEIILEEARKYYANIVLPYSGQVVKALAVAGGLDITMIAPGHGIIWKKHIGEIFSEYTGWANNKTGKKAIVVYDSMWKSTEKIAFCIYEAFESAGYNTSVFNLQFNHFSDIMTEMINTEYLCVGSPTLNGDIMPGVAAFLTYLRGLAPKGRKAVVFGSYGWAQQNIKRIKEYLSDFECVAEYAVNYIPSENDLLNIREDIKHKLLK
ncbi:MAG: FprA family A-type flavoprotein [Bacteroidetes bacterium]|nr:FprA family A-type flavoprotein [Bacteroidota bacterium]